MRVKLFFIFFILLLLAQSWAFGLEVNPHGDSEAGADLISDIYQAGPYLIYDCQEKHWVCVLESYHKDCQMKREKDLLDKEGLYHSCAPLGVLPTKKSCFQRQLFLTTHNYGTRFCIKDSWKTKATDF
jgi:hypothetical protein